MNRNIFVFLFLFLISFPTILQGQNKQGIQRQSTTSFAYKHLSTPNPSLEAEALYRYLQKIFGEKILSGQMSSQEGTNELEYIYSITGKQPALRGFDLEFENANKEEIQNTLKWWEAGGIPLIMWQWGAPTFGEGLENSKKEIVIEKCFQEGTHEYISFWKELKTKADHLETLRDANVPVLWCPFHEQSGNLFWWGKQGSAQFIKLWQTMYNYFTRERKLNNLIWVLNFTEEINNEWFPGNSYVDIIGASSYKNDSDPRPELFANNKIIANSNVTPLVYNECASLPDPDKCRKTNAMWCWWMQRPDSYLTNLNQDYLIDVYYNDLIVTLNEVPDIVKDFSGETVKRYFRSGATIPFSNLKVFDLGIKSGNISINDDRLEIDAKGEGIQGEKDEGYFAFQQIEGDFDISVQVFSLSLINSYTMAGIMARADLSKKSPHVFFHVFPNNNPKDNNSGGCELKFRTEESNQTMAVYPDLNTAGNKFNVDFPNTWIRLKRRGNLFKSFISHDNTNWYLYSVHTQNMPEKLLVGLAVSSNNKDLSTMAEFKDLEITWE